MIDLTGLNKAQVLSALYNKSKPLGMGYIHYTPEDMTVLEAERLLLDNTYFDYVKGRVMKVDLSGNSLNPRLYDRDNGEGAAERALKHLLK